MKKRIGFVTVEERDTIQNLFDRRNGLAELSKIMSADNDELYERMLRDITDTNDKFNLWWDTMAKKYHWERAKDGHWEIDFENCEIFLVTPE